MIGPSLPKADDSPTAVDPQQESALPLIDEPAEEQAEISKELAEKRTKTKEIAEKAGKKVTTKRLRKVVEKVRELKGEENTKWETQDEFKNERRLYMVHKINSWTPDNYPKNEDDSPQEISLNSTENPFIIYMNGEKVTLTTIKSITPNDTYICTTEITQDDGTTKTQELDVPRHQLAEGQIITEREAIRDTLPKDQQEAFDVYIDILDAERQDLDIMEITTESQLEAIAETAENAMRPANHYEKEEIPKKAMEVAFDGKESKMIQEEIHTALQKKARERGVGIKQLSEEDTLDVQGEILDKHFEAKLKVAGYEDPEPELRPSSQDQANVGNWAIRYNNEHGKAPTPDQVKGYARRIIYARVKQQDREIIGDDKKFAEFTKVMSKKEKTALFALLAGILAWPIAEGIAPIPSERG